jgi:hypothetical protein
MKKLTTKEAIAETERLFDDGKVPLWQVVKFAHGHGLEEKHEHGKRLWVPKKKKGPDAN